MKKQSGFTLIELLLVLAIIGIISAIAIPALLSQRARARDKAAVANCENNVGDCVGMWDKMREAGTSAATAATSVMKALGNAHGPDKNPWTGAAAFTTTVTTAGSFSTIDTFVTGIKGKASLGQAYAVIQAPSGTTPGFVGIATLTSNNVNGSTNFIKASAIE